MSGGSILPGAAWSISVLFGCLLQVGLLITEYRDLFSRSDLSRPARAGWVAVSMLPLVGPLLYLLIEGRGLADRRLHDSIARLQVEDYLLSPAPPELEVPQAHRVMQEVTAQWLLETGAVTAAEYDLLTAHDRALVS